MQHPFQTLKPEYEQLLASMVVDAARMGVIDATAKRLVDLMEVYEREHAATSVPAAFLAGLDEREDGADQSRAIGQGDRWNRVSVNVPRGHGPFASKYDADLFYIHYDHLDDCSQPWSWPYACWKGEAWNGFGPRDYHGIHTGYLWAGTNHYRVGKYDADGHWNPDMVDQQLGLIPVLKRVVELRPDLAFDSAIPFAASPELAPAAPAPSPAGVGRGAPHDAAWLQDALNKVFLPPDSPLLIDGNYGRMTRTTVWQYERARGLAVDGIYGPQVDGQLMSDLEHGVHNQG